MFSWVSKYSFQQGRYTLTKLSFARQKWPNPAGHVLPVNMGRPGKVASEVSDLISYVTAVSAFWPKGEVAAEVVGEVLRMAEKEPGVFARLYDQYIGEYFKAGVGKSAVFTDAELDRRRSSAATRRRAAGSSPGTSRRS